jgi:N-acetylneuraminic acid mutarotase
MPFHIFPDPATAALLGRPAFIEFALSPGETARAFVPLPAFVGPDPELGGSPTLFVGFNVVGGRPVVDLIAGDPVSGAARARRVDPASNKDIGSAVELFDGVNKTSAALAFFAGPSGPTFYLLKIVVEIPASFSLRLVNTGGSVCSYIWVAADSAEATKQPWLTVEADGSGEAAVVPVDAYVGQPVELNATWLSVSNTGAGPVTLVGFDPPLPAPYVVRGLPVTVSANSRWGGVHVGVEASAPADIAPATFHFVTRDKHDPGPFGPDFHFDSVTLSAHIAANNLWAPRRPLSFLSKSERVAATAWGNVYLVGGVDPGTSVFLSSVLSYNSSDDSWSAEKDMPTARAGLGVVIPRGANGRSAIYAIGGVGAPPTNICGTNEAYDLSTRQWTTLRPMPTPRQFFALAVGGDGLIYAIGGSNADHVALDTVEAYDPASDSWTSRQPLPSPRASLAAATGDDGHIYVAGGARGNTPFDDLSVYDPQTGLWTSRRPLPTPRGSLAFAAGRNGRFYAAGGMVAGACIRRTEEYDPRADAWRVRADMNVARGYFSMAADYAGRLFAVGGDFTQSTTTVEIFTP